MRQEIGSHGIHEQGHGYSHNTDFCSSLFLFFLLNTSRQLWLRLLLSLVFDV
jgi:hypothetical protein